MLVIDKIYVTRNKRKILDGVSLSIDRGEIAVLLGESGVGKSTLLRVLNNLEPIDSGTVTFNGKKLDLKKVNKDHIVGMLFQNFNLFTHLSVAENITSTLEIVLGKEKSEADKIAKRLLAQYGLQDKANNMVTQLSGGQKQRLAIARALSLQPKIMCLDEPTSALDPMLTSYVANTIVELGKQGITVLIATHDTVILEKIPCTIHLMKYGKIVESAHSHEFAKNPEKFSQINTFVMGKIPNE